MNLGSLVEGIIRLPHVAVESSPRYLVRGLLLWSLSATLLPGCISSQNTPGRDLAADGLTEGSCPTWPLIGPPGAWRNPTKSSGVVALGKANHRGIDLIASSSTAVQRIRGEIRYSLVDKALEGEAVDLFACHGGVWKPLGSVITNEEGEFELRLTGDARLPIGLRPLFASVAGDHSGVEFLALVAPEGTTLVVSDVDGTLTEREGAFNPLLGTPVAAHNGAAQALLVLRQRGYWPVYLTARSRVFTEATRTWLREGGFPAGPLRLASSLVTLPGDPTLRYKANQMRDITAAGLVISIGIGNRATDAEAYRQVNVDPLRIILKRPEFAGEIDPIIAAGMALGFDSYPSLLPKLQALPMAQSSK